MTIFWNFQRESSAPRGLRRSGGGQIQHEQWLQNQWPRCRLRRGGAGPVEHGVGALRANPAGAGVEAEDGLQAAPRARHRRHPVQGIETLENDQHAGLKIEGFNEASIAVALSEENRSSCRGADPSVGG